VALAAARERAAVRAKAARVAELRERAALNSRIADERAVLFEAQRAARLGGAL
jgi:hypothetical protein